MHFNWLWKSIALLALLLYVALGFVLVRFVVQNFLFAVLFVCTAAYLLYTGWLVFTGGSAQSRRARWFLWAGLLAFAAEAVYFISRVSSFWTLMGFYALAGLYIALIRLVRSTYWRQKRQFAQKTQPTAQFQKPYLIINPKSGNGRAMKAHIDELAKQQGIEVLMLRKGDDVEAVARQAVKAGADVLGISGGDGSIGAVAKVALEQQLPVVILPGGTRCHFARDLGLDPKRIADALAGFQGVKRLVDVGTINGRTFLNNVSFGLYADIVDKPAYRDNKLQVARQVLQSIVSGERDSYDLQFRSDQRHFRRAVQVLVSVNCYDTVNILELGHRETLDGGVLQVTAITKLTDDTIKKLMKTFSTDKLRGADGISDMIQWKAQIFKMDNADGRIVAGVDGEREEYSTPATVRIQPKALSVYVPAEGIRPRPKNIFSLTVVKRLWRLTPRGS